MNSRRSVNEANVVNFSTDLTTLNQLERRETLLNFPFDHLYACHAEGPSVLQLDREVEISTHCVVTDDKELVIDNSAEIARLTERLSQSEDQNKKLNDLLDYHLDLVQKQSEFIRSREKVYQSLREENNALKSKLNVLDKRLTDRVTPRQPSLTFTPLCLPPPTRSVPVTSTVVNQQNEPTKPITLKAFKEVSLPSPESSQFIDENDIIIEEYLGTDSNDSGTSPHDLVQAEMAILTDPVYSDQPFESRFKLITSTSDEFDKILNKKEVSPSFGIIRELTKNRDVDKGNPNNKKKTLGGNKFNVNKKSNMVNTYVKPNKLGGIKKTNQFGSLSDRLQLIDTTPTGEDPYQIGEAEMREQSPIPKLMLQKTSQGRMGICSDTRSKSTVTSKNMYGSPSNEGNTVTAAIRNESTHNNNGLFELDVEILKIESNCEWDTPNIPTKPGKETSLCDFSYGETSTGLKSKVVSPLKSEYLQGSFKHDSYDIYSDKNMKRTATVEDIMVADNAPSTAKPKSQGRRGRKRALSTTGVGKTKTPRAPPKPRASRGGYRGRKNTFPGMVTRKPYYTQVGDPDISWYYRLDPNIQLDDIKETDPGASIEVPRYREKLYTSCNDSGGTENLDDKTFIKRHRKYEIEEKRQLRWHMSQVREQKRIERLRQRHKDPWAASTSKQPSVYTIWPKPQSDLLYIEITDALPVTAFGEQIPNIPERDFMLPWIRSTKALKRSKRSITLH